MYVHCALAWNPRKKKNTRQVTIHKALLMSVPDGTTREEVYSHFLSLS